MEKNEPFILLNPNGFLLVIPLYLYLALAVVRYEPQHHKPYLNKCPLIISVYSLANTTRSTVAEKLRATILITRVLP